MSDGSVLLGWLIASCFSSVARVESREAHVFCWENGHSKEDCCKIGASACFDSIYTRSECCDGTGWAKLYPKAEPVDVDWEAAREWGRATHTGRTRVAARTGRYYHPSLSRSQLSWEHEMANSSVLLSETVLGHRIDLHIFKRSGPSFGTVFRELQDDVYRLKYATPSYTDRQAVIDIGASVGVVAVLLCKLWPGLRIVAVEPAPSNFRYLLWNIRENDAVDCVWPLNLAVSGAPAAAQSFFYSPTYPTWSQSDGSGLSESDESWRGGWTDWQIRFDVQVVTLAEIVAGLDLGDVHLLKVDCEGCEWTVFAVPQWFRLRHRVHHVTTELHYWAAGNSSDHLIEGIKAELCLHEKAGHMNERNTLCSTM